MGYISQVPILSEFSGLELVLSFINLSPTQQKHTYAF